MSDESALWAAIKSNPGEDAPKLALADWYGDHERPDMLHALRWCVSRGKWPRLTPKGTTAIWYGSSRVTSRWLTRVDEAHALPGLVRDAFPTARQRHAEMRFKTLHEAILYLAAALDKLRQAYEVKA
ncbi:hypothetical protein B7486_61600 [cyanobacterium TDX16]|nr:hypothetical protein B7486_61600 [cyanobacterium TDX16]